jgi:SAM-dependent methyltransferase
MSKPDADPVQRNYDRLLFDPLVDEFYGHSNYWNVGYWLGSTQTLAEACDNLMEKLLAFIPRKCGTILDVACGLGATTRYLLKYFRPEDVTGINLVEKQLRRCRENAPGCTFLPMDATRLEFPDESFDHLICVEAAFHFDTRDRFFREAFRVLKPGGHLVLSDILFRRGMEATTPILNVKNWVPDPGAYAEKLRRAGFEDVRVVDATEQCAEGFFRYRSQYLLLAYLAGRIDVMTFHTRRIRGMSKELDMTYYVLAGAIKPDTTARRAPAISVRVVSETTPRTAGADADSAPRGLWRRRGVRDPS